MFSPDGTLISASAAPAAGVVSGMKETFRKRYVVERTSEAEIRPEEESQKTGSCRENLWNEIHLKGHKDRNRLENKMKRSGQARLVYVRHKP